MPSHSRNPSSGFFTKAISPGSVRDQNFREPLLAVMERRGVPIAVVRSLFSTGEAAPSTAGFAVFNNLGVSTSWVAPAVQEARVLTAQPEDTAPTSVSNRRRWPLSD